jgi:hypothetical protein
MNRWSFESDAPPEVSRSDAFPFGRCYGQRITKDRPF